MAYTKKQTLKYVFSEKHKEYIRRCVSCEFNVAEGAVRAGKTVDNVYAFAHELKTAPDRIHLATALAPDPDCLCCHYPSTENCLCARSTGQNG